MDASQIKQIIQWSTQQRTGYDSYGNSKGNNVEWDAKYYNGQITEVIQCFTNQYLLDFRISATFCKRYIMEHETLAYVLTQYENISTEVLKSKYETSYGDKRIGDFYFSDDYQNYSKIYLAKNGMATIEWRKTEINSLPVNIKAQIQKKIKDKEDEKNKKQQAEATKKAKEKEIKSKTYDLALYDSIRYKNLVSNFLTDIEDLLKSNSMFPDFNAIKEQQDKFFVFKNIYNAYYKLVDYSRPSVDRGYYIEAGSNDIRNENKFTLVSGTDDNCRFIKKVSFNLPILLIQGYKVMTEAKINNISVEYIKGITKVKIKNGVVTFVKDNPPPEAQEKLIEQLKTETNGTTYIKYQIGKIMDRPFIIVDKL